MSSWINKIKNTFRRNKQLSELDTVIREAMDAAIYNAYSPVIGEVIEYFNELTVPEKWRFIRRTHEFKQQKKFHFIGLEKNDDIAILISASAVQVTFGLKKFHLNHFKDIYVLADAYSMQDEEELYVGHVAPDGIYLSWKHFLYGYADRHDNINVAIHEMSHALLFNNFFIQYGQGDQNFRMNYEKFSRSTGPIFADVITTRKSYLRSYAFSNLHEFWAVSVEAFFENPEELRQHMPQLFQAISKVLNQDPSTSRKIINSEI